MQATALRVVDFSKVEELLWKNDMLVSVPAAELRRFTQEQLSNFCHAYGIYQLITDELVEFVRKEIGTAFAIEIGAGNGCLARTLGIPATDNFMQTWPDIKRFYASIHQPTVRYGFDVREIDANAATLAIKPDVVVGCWITHYSQEPGSGNFYGVREQNLNVKKYIMVGNRKTHGTKPMLRTHPYREVQADWLFSRSMSKKDNVIYIFEG